MIEALIGFALEKGLLAPENVRVARNALLYALRMDEPSEEETSAVGEGSETATSLLTALCDEAVRRGLIEDLNEDRASFSAHLMNLLTPPPSEVISRFAWLREQDGTLAATDWFYALCCANDYVRVNEIAKNIEYTCASSFGNLEITINLSKPEKDPKEIAREAKMPKVGYPLCMLCAENEGYAGRPGYPTHECLRMIPLTLGGESWWFQYSPYAYFKEHCIALNNLHVPMSITRRTFTLLLDFVDLFPHYFIGSNADLPVVGGSILSHDHFQGGRHLFPMDKAPVYADFRHPDFPQIAIGAVRWPMTCVRLVSEDRLALTDLADQLLSEWRGYDDASQQVLHETDQDGQKTPHNTITPIARRLEDGQYMLQLVLRNNRTTPEHPLGIFHPHAQLHHIKRENIGLIEVMGLFILPGRLDTELVALKGYLTGEKALVPPPEDNPLFKHYSWIWDLAEHHGTTLSAAQARKIMRQALCVKCEQVLRDAGVFKATPEGDAALARFLVSSGMECIEMANTLQCESRVEC